MTTYDPDELLGDPALHAAVGALASRNQHHLQAMTEAEQADALNHWRELARDVLTAARSVVGQGGGTVDGTPGRAVLVFEDAGGEEVSVHVAFHPELEDMGDGQVAGTPAQITAFAVLERLNESEDGEGELNGGDEAGET